MKSQTGQTNRNTKRRNASWQAKPVVVPVIEIEEHIMAAPKRSKGLARWAIVAGTGLVGISFWVAVLRGPHPANNTPASSSASQQGQSQLTQQNPGFQAGNSFSPSVQVPSQSSFVQAPRFRTRSS